VGNYKRKILKKENKLSFKKKSKSQEKNTLSIKKKSKIQEKKKENALKIMKKKV